MFAIFKHHKFQNTKIYAVKTPFPQEFTVQQILTSFARMYLPKIGRYKTLAI